MLVTSITTFFESNVNDGRQNYTGLIEEPAELLKPDNLAKLDQSFQGVFCFLAFHPRHDPAVLDYVCSTSFAADTGSHVLALFTLEESALTPQIMDRNLLGNWIDVGESNYPAYEIVGKLFPSVKPPALPGVLIARRLAQSSEPVYVPLGRELKAEQVASFMRSLFLHTDEGYRLSVRDFVAFAPELGKVLAREGIPYLRLAPLSFSEWLFKSIHFLRAKGGDIVTVVKLASGFVSKKEKE